jgi:hypothetical protein
MKRYRLQGYYDDHLQEDESVLDWLTALRADQVVIDWQYERERGTAATISMITVQFLDLEAEILFLLKYSDQILETENI